MNMGHEEEELKPYIEPMADLKDPKRIGKTGTVYKEITICWCNVTVSTGWNFVLGMNLHFIIFLMCNAIKLKLCDQSIEDCILVAVDCIGIFIK